MEVRLLDNFTVARLVQSSNAPHPMLVTVSGMLTACSSLFPEIFGDRSLVLIIQRIGVSGKRKTVSPDPAGAASRIGAVPIPGIDRRIITAVPARTIIDPFSVIPMEAELNRTVSLAEYFFAYAG